MKQFIEFVVNHWELFLALAFILAMLVGGEIARRLRNITDINPFEATQLVNRQDALLLDVREQREYQEGHAQHAVHIPLAALSERIRELEKYKGRPIIVYCRSGHRSGRAGAVLHKHGFETVYNLGGGLLAWQNASLPVSRKK